jgi:hypothetical protein
MINVNKRLTSKFHYVMLKMWRKTIVHIVIIILLLDADT